MDQTAREAARQKQAEEADRRWDRERAMDGELRDIPAKHRLTIVRQLLIALDGQDLLCQDRDGFHDRLRAIAERVGVPFVEMLFAEQAGLQGPDATRADVDDWLEWCREHAPERLKESPAKVAAKVKAPRRKTSQRRAA